MALGRRTLRPSQWAIAAVAVLLALLAVYNAAIAQSAQADADPLSIAANAAPVVEFSLERRAVMPLDAGSAAQLLAAAQAALSNNPLSSRAPYAAAIALDRLGERSAADRAMALAVARDPRNVSGHQWLVARYLRAGRYPGALDQLDAIMRLRPALSFDITRAMVPFLHAPGMAQAFAEAGAHNPPWLPQFLDHASRDASVAPAVYALARALGSDPRVDLPLVSITSIVEAALSRGDTPQAVAVYRAFFPAAASGDSNLVFDGTFQGLAGAPPFSWAFHEGVGGGAMPDGAEGLAAEVRSGPALDLVTQAIVLPPGGYRLEAGIRSSNLIGATALTWQLRCVRSGLVLVDLAMPISTDRPQALHADVTVPPGCDGVTLALRSGGDGGSGEAVLSSITLRPVDALP